MRPAVQIAVVLAGGGSRRLGRDKLAVDIGATSVLDRLLGGVAATLPGVPIVCVGPPRTTVQDVQWCQEQPAGGGPAAALASALASRPASSLSSGLSSGLAAVLAGDLPFGADALPELTAATADDLGAADAWLAVDGQHVLQPLLGVYRCASLRTALAGGGVGRSVRSLLAGMRVRGVAVPARALLDVDTEQDVAVVRAEAAQAHRDRLA